MEMSIKAIKISPDVLIWLSLSSFYPSLKVQAGDVDGTVAGFSFHCRQP